MLHEAFRISPPPDFRDLCAPTRRGPAFGAAGARLTAAGPVGTGAAALGNGRGAEGLGCYLATEAVKVG